MSIHTIINKEQLTHLLKAYHLGELRYFSGVEEGVTNTIYKISTSLGDFILTLFEELKVEEVPFFIELITYLNTHGLTCAEIVMNKDNERITIFNDKPVIISDFLPGKTLLQPTFKQCEVIGKELAKLHQITEDFPGYRKNPFTLQWHIDLAKQVSPYLSDVEQKLLCAELLHQGEQCYERLPCGMVHMDLFPDNVLFSGDNLTGLLDFYFACYDNFLLDLAITMNAWSLSSHGLRNTCAEKILVQYQLQRSLNSQEIRQLKNMRRYAALHFWLTRLRDKYLVSPKVGVLVKEPKQFLELLSFLVDYV